MIEEEEEKKEENIKVTFQGDLNEVQNNNNGFNFLETSNLIEFSAKKE